MDLADLPNNYVAKVRNTIILYYDQQMINYLTNDHTHMFRHCRVILSELIINALPSYTSISKAVFGNIILYLRCFT